MGHAIEENDILCVGYTGLYGKAWHDHPQTTHLEEDVPLQFAEECFDFKVEKRPVYIPNNDGNMMLVPDQFHLVDTSTDTVLSYGTVREAYTVVQNSVWFANIVGGVMASHDLKVESCGTLFNRKKSFLNTVVMEHTVKGDVSPTRTRLLYTNAYDNCAMSACATQTRVVCANTLRIAQAEGAANNTLKKFRHTAGAMEAMEGYTIELAELVGAVKVHNDHLDRLAEMSVSPQFVANYLNSLFGYSEDKKDGRGKTMAKKKVDRVLEIFETKDDLNSSAIRGTRYALLNAVTDWADHESPLRGEADSMTREWSGFDGAIDNVKQRAFNLIGA